MKKIVLIMLVALVAAAGAFAEGPDHFSFTLGAGAGYDMIADTIDATQVYGVDYNFNNTFSGGFKFFDIGGTSVAAVNVAVSPVDNAYISLFTGAETAGPIVAFGAGLEYDFFTKKDGLFTGMGVFVDWLATNGGVFNVSDGGVVTFGLKTKIGI